MTKRKRETAHTHVKWKSGSARSRSTTIHNAAIVLAVLSVALLVMNYIGIWGAIGTNSSTIFSATTSGMMTKKISGTYSGHYSEVPESDSLDWNGDMSFIMDSDNKMTVNIVTKGGNEIGNFPVIVNGTELRVIMPPDNKEKIRGRDNTCIIIGAFSEAADSIAGTVTCDNANKTADWTVSKVSDPLK